MDDPTDFFLHTPHLFPNPLLNSAVLFKMDTLNKLECEAIPDADERMLEKVGKLLSISEDRERQYEAGYQAGRKEIREETAVRMFENGIDEKKFGKFWMITTLFEREYEAGRQSVREEVAVRMLENGFNIKQICIAANFGREEVEKLRHGLSE